MSLNAFPNVRRRFAALYALGQVLNSVEPAKLARIENLGELVNSLTTDAECSVCEALDTLPG